jgi:hypothetical protein
VLIIFLTIGHVEPLRVVTEEIGFGATSGAAAGALGAWVLRTFGRRESGVCHNGVANDVPDGYLRGVCS